MSGLEVVVVLVAALACGAVNALAGGGSLILFPALAATGMGTLSANVTNSLATWPGYVGSIGGFRAELAAHRHRFGRLAAATVVGSLAGCVLLLATPTEAFDRVVPVLVLLAAALVAVQPLVVRRMGAPVEHRRTRQVQVLAVALAAVYGGYFGAALGVIFLGVLGLTVDAPLRDLNGLKAGLSLVDATVSVVVFGLFGPVQWAAVAIAAPAALVGGYLGARFARRVPERPLRIGVVAFSVGVAVVLAVR
ncbi:MAG: sulfite exporter TauE/SafE family protein [Acidimicrobiales bacterium]|nr:sulfite exporter TauE/SafE family protein [Acidimicrobiales bacterium]